MKLENHTILIISPENWGDVFLSKHHYAIELSKKNKVWFLNAKGNRSLKCLIQTTQINNTLFVLDYYNLFYGFGKIPFLFTNCINSFLSKKIKNTIGKVDIVWNFEQAKFFNLKLFKAKHSIFHPVDYIPSFLDFKTRLANSSDLIISVSKEILTTINSDQPKHFINHGISPKENSLPAKLKYPINSNKTNVGYIGNINIPYIDIENLSNSIERNSNFDFHFFGPTASSNLGNNSSTLNFDKINAYKNTYFQGIINQNNLKESVNEIDIFISCYDYNKYPIRLSNSHKILEYLSTGKVVISNYFPIYKNIPENLMLIIDELSNFDMAIKKVSAQLDFYNNPKNQSERIKFANNYSYKNQLKKIEQILNII